MKYSYLVVILCAIIICSVLAVPFLLQRVSPESEDKSSATPTPTNTTPIPTSTTSQGTTPVPTRIPNSPQPNSQPSVPIPTPLAHAPDRSLLEEIGNATEYLAQQNDPYAILNADVLYRQFGIAQFSNSLEKYDLAIASKSDTTLVLFRRIASYDNPVNSSYFNNLQSDVDKITIPALYADRQPLPANYSAMLQAGLNGGDYLTTHTLLATLWLKENNCSVSLPANFMSQLYHDTAALIDNDSVVSDIELEAAALLYDAGQGQLVSSSFVKLVMENQNMDGGWAPITDINPNMSAWHPTFLALMLLLNVEYPSSSCRAWLAPAP
jgi:hypothetical protein